MKTPRMLVGGAAALLLLAACDDDTETRIETVETPVIVQVPAGAAFNVELGPRPYYLVDDMDEGALKDQLAACADGPFYKTDFSIGHRGAPLQFPEHTRESYEAAARMGAGILECDVTFTSDQELVCRHSQCDLHTTTNILAIPELAAKCSVPFTPADPDSGTPAQVQCCTSDITLAEFRTLQGKMDAANPMGTTIEEYMDGTADYRTDLYASNGTLMTHAESVELFKTLGVKMTPELKSPSATMPFNGFTQEDYAQKLIDELKAAGVPAEDVYVQSFNLSDVQYWIGAEPEFGNQAVYLDGRYSDPAFDPSDSSSWTPSMDQLVADGVKIIAPPLWVLVAEEGDAIVPSVYATAAREAGLDIITWTLERSGRLSDGGPEQNGGWYYQTIGNITNNDGDVFALLDVLAKDVGVLGVFSDWPATTTYYASCMRLPASL
ncbi:glycerophosphodiester phosphodiesterase family protein [Aliagarivorans taiwanensis]|uniref:glycerophosphodiester phosphodiesterase family protein n=1 Tax=Aliagarivorans taiwanensis TaxID=561966 RepID=UPI000410DD26